MCEGEGIPNNMFATMRLDSKIKIYTSFAELSRGEKCISYKSVLKLTPPSANSEISANAQTSISRVTYHTIYEKNFKIWVPAPLFIEK